MSRPRSRQPWLHRLETAVHGNVAALGLVTGDIDHEHADGAATGLFVDDRRVLSHLVLTVDGVTPVGVVASSEGATTQCLLLARNVGDPGPDPTVEVRRTRTLSGSGMAEQVAVTSRAAETVRCEVTLVVRGDGAELHDVKSGSAPSAPLPVTLVDAEQATWGDDRHSTRVDAPGAGLELEPDSRGVLARWPVVLPPGGTVRLHLDVSTTRTSTTPFDAAAGAALVPWTDVRVDSADSHLVRTVRHSLTDLRHLLLSDPLDPTDVFAAAGSPWYLTLFGRDSIWAARMTLPFGTDLARGTLRALARRQGVRDDVEAAEEPGKIPHEVRRTTFEDPGILHLPPTYYGTVDATPLWVCLLHDAWRWGLPQADVVALRPALDAALGWMRRSVDQSTDGLIRYHDTTGRGLGNQGWKDSGDAMRTASGAVAQGPIALVETQGYAVEAARGAADLLEAVFGQDGSPWRRWASELTGRVRERFWVTEVAGRRYPAMALDGEGRLVDGLGSNMGHVLGTGLLDDLETAAVAAALTSPDMLGPLGVRTLSSSNPAYNPLGYHTGSVWTHDTAICAHGLARAGRHAEAARCATVLVDVAAASAYRWPELYGADPVGGAPAPYPASCRPQAWAAASAGLLVSTLLGLRADVPGRRLEVRPLPSAPFGALRVEGIRLGGEAVTVEVDATGTVVDVLAPDGVEVVAGRDL